MKYTLILHIKSDDKRPMKKKTSFFCLFKMAMLLMLLSGGAHSYAQSAGRMNITGREDSIRQKVFAIGLPVMEINTVNREFPHYYSINAPEGCIGQSITGATKVPGRVSVVLGDSLLFDSGDYEEGISGMTLKIRGNTSARQPKKPYKIKLQKKADMLRRDNPDLEDKDWLLLTTACMLTDVGTYVSRYFDFAWTPSSEYVNLFLNGEYKGLYLLTESVEREKKSRVNIDRTGFLFEYDPYWWNEEVYVKSSIETRQMHYTFKYPESDEITQEQLDYFTQMIGEVEAAVNDGTYPERIDVTSFAQWILAHDLIGNRDWAGTNFYLTKYDDSDTTKVRMSVLWDFDSAMKNELYWFGGHTYFVYDSLFKSSNRAFVEEYLRLYDEMRPTFFDDVDEWLNQQAASPMLDALEESVHWDAIRWNYERDSVSSTIRQARQWFAERKTWMAQKTDSMRLALVPTGIQAAATVANENAYYNLLGQRMSSPSKGFFIRRGRKYVVR